MPVRMSGKLGMSCSKKHELINGTRSPGICVGSRNDCELKERGESDEKLHCELQMPSVQIYDSGLNRTVGGGLASEAAR